MKRAIILLAVMAASIANGQMFAQRFGGETWTPAALGSKLAIWYDASDSATVLDATGAPADNAEDVQTLQDKSGNARHATSPADAQRPTRQTGIQNGLAVLRTNGDDQLSIASAGDVFRNKTHGYIFTVAKDSNSASGDSIHGSVAFIAGGVRAGLYGRINNSVWSGVGRRLDGTSLAIAAGSAKAGHALSYVFCNWGGGVVSFTIDGAKSSASLPSSGATSDTDTTSNVLFSSTLAQRMPTGSEIAEVIIVNAEMTASEISSTQNYLKNKWGTP